MLMLLRISKIQLGTSVAKPAICLFLGIASIVIVTLIGRNQLKRYPDDEEGYYYSDNYRTILNTVERKERAVREILLNNFSAMNIIDNLKQLTQSMHVAGTKDNELVAEFIRNTWMKQGLQAVHFTEYNDVLLSYPDYQNPNRIEIFDNSGKIKFRIIGRSKVVIPSEQGDPGGTVTFNAYSANGTAKGVPVYVNYGTVEDYESLDKLSISLDGRIAIAKYGRIWRGDKVAEAQKRGAVGVILYSDPLDFAQAGTQDENVYPNTVWMPSFAVQRGTLLQMEGDPLTPLYPALNYITREYDEQYLMEHEIIPSIPVQPISYGDAWHILDAMAGPKVPQDWQGGLNVTYRYGPGFKESNLKLRMLVHTTNQKKSIRNVVGYIEGSEEPDRYVIVGNHFDAWVYGAVDPNSGTAVMLEMSRVFMTAINATGWRPRRTIVFCAWDAEEYSVIGSTEWIEQFTTILEHRALAYINVDLIPGNETLYMESSPSLIRIAVDSAKLVPNPRQDEVEKGRTTVYDTWYHLYPGNLSYEPKFPYVASPGAGSDHVQFIAYLGVPVSSFCYFNKSAANSSYPLYHTLYETIYLVDKLMDPDKFKTHIATGQFWAQFTYSLADSLLAPLNVTDYAYSILKFVDDLNANLNDTSLIAEEIPLQIHNLRQAAKSFLMETKKFYAFALDLKDLNAVTIERLNSRLSNVERCFVNPRGNPMKPTSRHVIYGLSPTNRYKGSEFASIYDQYISFKKAKSKEEQDFALKNLKMQLSIAQYSVECATQTLRKVPH